MCFGPSPTDLCKTSNNSCTLPLSSINLPCSLSCSHLLLAVTRPCCFTRARQIAHFHESRPSFCSMSEGRRCSSKSICDCWGCLRLRVWSLHRMRSARSPALSRDCCARSTRPDPEELQGSGIIHVRSRQSLQLPSDISVRQRGQTRTL